jgi:uncharacterized protein YndB with AHSA1/START domain
MKNGTFKLEARGDREIVITRSFDAPRQLVFEAWTRPELLRRWWGCEGSTLTTCEVDLRPGGRWRFVMRMPDGSEHPLKGIYRDILPPDKLVYTECYDLPSIGRPQWLTTIVFEVEGDKTKLTHALLHGSKEARNGHLQAGMEGGMIQSFKRLENLMRTPLLVEIGGNQSEA